MIRKIYCQEMNWFLSIYSKIFNKSCKTLFTILSLLFSSLLANGQINVELKEIEFNDEGLRVIQPISFLRDKQDYKGLEEWGENCHLGIYVLDVDQFYYSSFLRGRIEKERYLELKRPFINETDLFPGDTKSFVGILVVLREDYKTILVDTDNDHDFRNEVPQKYHLDTLHAWNNLDFYPYHKLKTLRISFERTVEGKPTGVNRLIKVEPFVRNTAFKNPLDLQRSVAIVPGGILYGTFKLKESLFELMILFTSENLGENFDRVRYLIKPALDPFDYKSWKWSKDVLEVGGIKFKLDNLNNLEGKATLIVVEQ